MNRIYSWIIAFTLFALCFVSRAQTYQADFGFTRELYMGVVGNGGIPLSNPFGGGINSITLSPIDLNGDGTLDFFLFEKHGNRILPYLMQGDSYHYAPEYRRLFPKIHDWVRVADFNHDGKNDLFTYGMGGIRVYQNVSQNELSFSLYTDQLNSYYYTGYTNLFTNSDDYIAIEDINHDGQLDILTFGVLGQYLHYHQNQATGSENNYFDFRLTSDCWGHIEEGEDNNLITLNSDCGTKATPTGSNTRHAGSTLSLADFFGNGLFDLIVGDMDSPDLILLTNGGTPQEALMVQQTTLFPNSVTPIHLYSMPVCSFVPLFPDSVPALIVSPSDPRLKQSEDIHSSWLYKKNGITQQYDLITRNFLQEDMIDVGSGACPILFDWNQDGLLDLFIANWGSFDSAQLHNGILESFYSSSITFYQNIGDAQNPQFQLITDDFGDLKSLNIRGLYPAFGDFNHDGTIDMLCGQEDGTLILFANSNDSSGLPIFSSMISNYQNISVQNSATPQYFDLDKDGKIDLLIGNRRGNIAYYRDISTDSIPLFQLITTTLGGIDIRDANISYFGYATPCFFRGHNGNTLLFCGNEQGNIFYYKDIDDHLNDNFTIDDLPLFEIHHQQRWAIQEGIRATVAVGDLNGDNYPDIFVGNWAGGLSYFVGTVPPDSSITEIHSPTLPNLPLQPVIYPNPATDFISIDHFDTTDPIVIKDMMGRTVLTIHQTKLIDIRSLPAGFYFLQSGKHSLKFIKWITK